MFLVAMPAFQGDWQPKRCCRVEGAVASPRRPTGRPGITAPGGDREACRVRYPLIRRTALFAGATKSEADDRNRFPAGRASAIAPVAELVDAANSKSVALTGVLVRFRPGAPLEVAAARAANQAAGRSTPDVRHAPTCLGRSEGGLEPRPAGLQAWAIERHAWMPH